MPHTYLESHGVKLDVEVQDADLIPAVQAILPPGWQPSDDFPEDGHFILSGDATTGYAVHAEGEAVGLNLPVDVALHLLDAQVRARVAVLATDRIFIHAGVVAIQGNAIVLPGVSFTGKSSLVAALVGAGATYYSDEYAVLDGDGMVHPYPRPLSLRDAGKRYGDYTEVSSLGGEAGTEPAAVAVIAVTRFVPGDSWTAETRPSGVGALALMSNAVPARDRPAEATRAIARAAANATVLEGTRGEADEAAAALLDVLAAARS